MPRLSVTLTALAVFALPLGRSAAQGVIHLGPPMTATVRIEAAPPPRAIDQPQPPKSLFQGVGFNRSRIRVPEGKGGLPLPPSPEIHPALPTPLAGPGAFVFYLNRPVQPSGARIDSVLCEPSGAINRDTALYTGNTFGALSKDSGMTWSYINPATQFPTIDGGVCCDQRVIHVPSPNMTMWLVEYWYSATTKTGSHRIAFARGRDDLRKKKFYSFVVSPKTFGFGNGYFMDYADISYANQHLYGSAIVAPCKKCPGRTTYVLWRAKLSDVYDLGGVGLSYYRGSQLGGYGNYRFAHGSTTNMFWAAHESTTKLRVYRWNEYSGNASIYRKTVSTWSGRPTPAPGPDRRDWTGFGWTTNCVLGGYANAGEVGFLWTSGSVPGRPRGFVRVARFRTSDVALIGQRDVWGSTFQVHFPYAATNARGHIGVTVAFGGGSYYPSAAAFVIDDYTSWATLGTIYPLRMGRAGPPYNRWGDFLHCWRNSSLPYTWVGTGFTKQTSSGSTEPRYVWFGRDRDKPTWVNLAVQSTPVSGVAITLPEHDRYDRGNGSTSFTRSYAPSQGYLLTAPLTVSVGRTTYAFYRWSLRVSPSAGFSDKAVGLRSLEVSTIGSLDDTAVAKYARRQQLTVTSRYATRVPITVSTSDIYGSKNGTTAFNRYYRDKDVVMLTAPPTAGTRRFYNWRLNSVSQPVGRTTLTMAMTTTRAAEAVYGFYTPGSFTSFGAGCRGSNGIPFENAGGVPLINGVATYYLRNGPRSKPVAFFLGFSKQWWGAFRLPLTLPGSTCKIYNDIVFMATGLTNSSGGAWAPIRIPNFAGLIGGHYYTQYLCADPGVNPLSLTTSNSVDTKVGGWNLR